VACGTVCGHHANQSLAPSRECCRQPNGRCLLPSQLDRASNVGHARIFANLRCLQEASCARPRKANSNRYREKHTASTTITHRIYGRFARRNKALLPSSTIPSPGDGDLMANVTFVTLRSMAAWHSMTKPHQILHSTSSVGPVFLKKPTFRTTYTCTCKLTLRPRDAPVRSLSFDAQFV
jgi:hypothetical protein